MSLANDRKELGLVRGHIADLLATGQAYSESESHSLTMADLGSLQTRERVLRRRIMRSKGYTGRIG